MQSITTIPIRCWVFGLFFFPFSSSLPQDVAVLACICFFPAHDSTCDWKAQGWSRAVLMSVTLAQGCHGADSMWSAEAKLGRCDSDNLLPYSWLCFQAQVLSLLLLEVVVQGHHRHQGRQPGPQAAWKKHGHEEEHRPWKRNQQGDWAGNAPKNTSPTAEAEAFPASPAKGNARPCTRELLGALWLLSHCCCSCWEFLSNSPHSLPPPALPPIAQSSDCDGWKVEGFSWGIYPATFELWRAVQLQQSFNLPLEFAGYFLLEKRFNRKFRTMSPVGFLPMMR